MAHPFEVRKDIEVDATPEEVWEAIATGPGLDSWFMGSNEVEPGEGGKVRMTLPGWSFESTITVWDPPSRLRTETLPGEDGASMAFEYLVEGRQGGATVVRFVHSGFLAGDGWEDEYEALKRGDPMYFLKLAEYLTYFPGRRAVPVDVYGPQTDADRAWKAIQTGLGLPDGVSVGDRVRLAPEGVPAMEGVIDYLSDEFLGIRTGDGMYRFIHGFDGTVVLGHHLFSSVDPEEAQLAWQSWLERSLA